MSSVQSKMIWSRLTTKSVKELRQCSEMFVQKLFTKRRNQHLGNPMSVHFFLEEEAVNAMKLT